MPGPDFSIAGKVAIVTGATRGIGAHLAGALAGAGAAVALLGRDLETLMPTCATLSATGAHVQGLCADVTDVSAVQAAFEQVVARMGRLDILINNAGIEQLCPSLEVSPELWDRIIDTNLRGAFFCAQAAAQRMSAGGSILNLCSLTSEVGVAGAAPYGASKSGLAGLTRALATEWASLGIRVNGIGPGYFRTALTERFYRSERWQQQMLDQIPLRRFGRLDDLSGAAVFLCSDAARYITGQILYVDGGYLAAL
jgi:NAD(P)-dependent dehydrogenase (short-subunit alcohol dehydrogenase family)